MLPINSHSLPEQSSREKEERWCLGRSSKLNPGRPGSHPTLPLTSYITLSQKFTMNLGKFPELFCIHYIKGSAVNPESHGKRDGSFHLSLHITITTYNYIYITNYQIVAYKSVFCLSREDNCRNIVGTDRFTPILPLGKLSLREMK